MRLLYVIDSLAPGGAETSLAEMTPYLVAQGVDLHVLPLGQQLDLAARLETGGAVVHRRDATSGRIGNVRAVLDTIRTTRPSAVHTTLFESDVAGRTAARLRGVPVSTSLVNDSYSPAHRREHRAGRVASAQALDAATARATTRFHAISGAVADAVGPRLGIPRDRIEVIPRGRDPLSFPFRPVGVRSRVREELGLESEVPVVLGVGRLDPQKGIQHLLAAAAVVETSVPGVVLLLAGKEGRSGAQLRERAATTGVDIRFLGHRNDVSALMSAADVFCFPSEREGFGGVLLEAMAVGCPIVATGIPTTVEVLGQRGDPVGVITAAADPGALSRAIVEVLTDPEASRARARRGRERFEKHFTIERVAAQMAAFFECVTATP